MILKRAPSPEKERRRSSGKAAKRNRPLCPMKQSSDLCLASRASAVLRIVYKRLLSSHFFASCKPFDPSGALFTSWTKTRWPRGLRILVLAVVCVLAGEPSIIFYMSHRAQMMARTGLQQPLVFVYGIGLSVCFCIVCICLWSHRIVGLRPLRAFGSNWRQRQICQCVASGDFLTKEFVKKLSRGSTVWAAKITFKGVRRLWSCVFLKKLDARSSLRHSPQKSQKRGHL